MCRGGGTRRRVASYPGIVIAVIYEYRCRMDQCHVSHPLTDVYNATRTYEHNLLVASIV